MAAIFTGIDFALHEAALFAACGFLVLGLSDLAVDLIWIGRTAWRRMAVYSRFERAAADRLCAPIAPGRFAVFVPAWDEADVIGDMLAHALTSFGDADYRIFVGCYPNDPAGIAAVRVIADPRIRLVVGPVAGPTTKADCLNRLWSAMLDAEAGDGIRYKAIVLHDAEDLVHPAELRVFDLLIERFDLVQLPVLPLVDRTSPLIAGHYADEFAESHGKELIVREALGAAIPSAGVGCAFSRNALERIAALNGGAPFDAASLTEDYELGLKLKAVGGQGAFVRLPASAGRPVVSTREHFPATFDAAVQQKSRWMVGIALSGWDRLGWSGGIAERWMRLRDRQAPLAALLLFAGYLSLLLEGVLLPARLAGYEPRPFEPMLSLLVSLNFALLGWRLLMRFLFVRQAYGWRQAFWSPLRMIVGNFVAMFAARAALLRYLGIRRTGQARWGKTVHRFPSELPAE
jgi:adsorption protein B